MDNLKESELFEIEMEHLKDIEVFPFHLYVYNPSKKIYNLYLEANTPLTDQKLTFIQYILQRKGKLAISKNQEMTFLEHMNYSASDIPSLCKEPDLKQAEETNFVIDFNFEDEFVEADKTNDHIKLIEAMRIQVEKFSLKINHTVSLASYLVASLANEDNLTNRVVALAYHLAKQSKVDDSKSLSDIIVAGYLSHIGYTQMDMKMSSSPQLLMGDRMTSQHKKHLGLSQHLVRKSGVDISTRCKKIINQHHERADGKGYPNEKSKHQIEPLAIILGCSSHLIEFSMGLIDGNKQQILPLIKLLEKNERKPGLEVEFGQRVLQDLISVVKSEFKDEAA